MALKRFRVTAPAVDLPLSSHALGLFHGEREREREREWRQVMNDLGEGEQPQDY